MPAGARPADRRRSKVNAGMFSLLHGISPFYWIALAFLLGAAVMVTSIDMILWPAIAALAVGLALFFVPDLSGQAQILAFAVLSVCAALAARAVMPRFGQGGKPGVSLNEPAQRMVGRRATVIEASGAEGKVTIDQVRWHAKWKTGVAKNADSVRVVGSEGTTLIVQADTAE